MEYVVTGGAGYIGGHLVDRLVYEGKKVTVLDDLSTGNYVNKASRFLKFDLRNRNDLKIKESSCIMHLAANPDVRASMTDLEDFFERNVTGTMNALEIARKSDAKSFIFTSTSAVYGDIDWAVPESHEKHPISNYGLFKLLGEEMVRNYAENYGIKSVALRFGNVTGGRVTHGVVSNWAKMVNVHKPIEIWGDGSQRRSYVYYTDVLDAIALCAKRSKTVFDVFNVSSRDAISVNQAKQILSKELRWNLDCVYTPKKEGDADCVILDTRKIAKKIGWKARFSSKTAVAQAFRDAIF